MKASSHEHHPQNQRAPSSTVRSGLAHANAPPAAPSGVGSRQAVGLPTPLQSTIERMSGLPMQDVRVFYNSPKPAAFQALAYTQGTHIHVAPGQDQHLPHEAWHVVQQKQGRVRPTAPLAKRAPNTTSAANGPLLNDAPHLEREADVMGARAMQQARSYAPTTAAAPAACGHTRAPQNAPIQRKVGFECELSVPTFGKPNDGGTVFPGPDGKQPEAAVQWFLLGGRPYGERLTATNGNFRLTADHNLIQRRHYDLVSKLIDKKRMTTTNAFRTMSNLEYVTEPIDELAAKSTAKLKTTLSQVAQHSATTYEAAKANIAQVSGPQAIFTGVPKDSLKKWLGPEYSDVSAEVDGIHDAITDKLYLQMTAGVLPSSIRHVYAYTVPELVQFSSKYTDEGKKIIEAQYSGPITAATEVVNELLSQPDFIEFDYIKNLRKKENRVDYKSFQGVLILTCSYVIGAALLKTPRSQGSTVKNLVPFMSKLHNFRDAITLAAPELHANRPPEEVIAHVEDFFLTHPRCQTAAWLDPDKAPLTTEELAEAEANPAIGPSFVRDVFRAVPDTAAAPRPRTRLGTADSRTFTQPDQVPSAPRNQGGVQLEFRYILEHPKPTELSRTLMKYVDIVRRANTMELPVQEQVKILNKANSG